MLVIYDEKLSNWLTALSFTQRQKATHKRVLVITDEDLMITGAGLVDTFSDLVINEMMPTKQKLGLANSSHRIGMTSRSRQSVQDRNTRNSPESSSYSEMSRSRYAPHWWQRTSNLRNGLCNLGSRERPSSRRINTWGVVCNMRVAWHERWDKNGLS